MLFRYFQDRELTKTYVIFCKCTVLWGECAGFARAQGHELTNNYIIFCKFVVFCRFPLHGLLWICSVLDVWWGIVVANLPTKKIPGRTRTPRYKFQIGPGNVANPSRTQHCSATTTQGCSQHSQGMQTARHVEVHSNPTIVNRLSGPKPHSRGLLCMAILIPTRPTLGKT